MGFFEKKGFENGTRGVWNAVLGNKKAHVVVGGGETVSSLAQLIPADYKRIIADTYLRQSAGNQRKSVFLSTGGGAMLDYLSGEKLPGIEALRR